MPGRVKAKEEYLLTTKLFCGYCKELMVGYKGTSKSGRSYHYYCCKKARQHLCQKKIVRKDLIEDCVVAACLDLLTDENMAFIARKVVEECSIPRMDAEHLVYARHPLSYMMEAADDICYLILDMEDAHKRGIVSTEAIESCFTSFFSEKKDKGFFNHKDEVYRNVSDVNERMAFLRAMLINKLVNLSSDIFVKNYDTIMEGRFEKSLIAHLPEFEKNALELCRNESIKHIYRHPSVVKIELTGFNVIGTLLEEFTDAVLNPDTPYNKKLLSLIPEQFKVETGDTYTRLQSVIDFISNMTDLYAVQLYKDLRGID